MLAHIVYFQHLRGVIKNTNMFKESEKNKQMNLFLLAAHLPFGFRGENQIQLILTGLQGRPSRYDLSFDDTQGSLTVIDRETGEIQQAIEAKPKKNTPVKRWRIKTGKGYRYFDENDVKATIFQLGYWIIRSIPTHFPVKKPGFKKKLIL